MEMLSSRGPEDYQVFLGAYNHNEQDAEEVINALQLILHEEYDEEHPSIPNDIGLIELEREADLSNPNIGLGVLPRRGEDFAHTEHCWIAGWGRLGIISFIQSINQSINHSSADPNPENMTGSPILHEVNTAIHTLDECRSIWEDFLNSTETNILDQHICIGLPDLGACHVSRLSFLVASVRHPPTARRGFDSHRQQASSLLCRLIFMSKSERALGQRQKNK
jgi:hypothetical protein